jgi:hypothetical protein
MVEDDHYVPNSKNAHIDTSEFEKRVRQQLSEGEVGVDEVLESVYNLVFSRFSRPPREPDDDKLICRYLSPTKLLQFLHTRRVNFPAATQFSDPWECRVPEDYENAVLTVLCELGVSVESWNGLIRRKAGCWKISCWTEIDDYWDDHLMWEAYAGGPQGVGITVRYGVLKNSLAPAVGSLAADGVLHSGRVNYEELCLLPFNKHYMFRNEREVRFAFNTTGSSAQSVSIDEIFGSFGVRVSPVATVEHYEMVRRLWLSFGGVDRVQLPR